MSLAGKMFSLDVAGSGELRLDRFLAQALPQFSRARLQTLIRDGYVKVEGVRAQKSGQSLRAGSQITVEIPAVSEASLRAEEIPLTVVFENDAVLVVNKPAGMVVHPSAGHADGTLVNAALGHDPDMEGVGGEERPGVVHRLDKDTSGLIILAKTNNALLWLQEEFRLRRAHKTYLGLVDGHPRVGAGRIETAIGRDPNHRKRMAIVPAAKGRAAITEFRVVETFESHSLLEIHPITGRTHQIRLHCAFLGTPIAGDMVYGRRTASLALTRQFLHASRLSVRLPGDLDASEFFAPLPTDLALVLNLLRNPGERKR